MRRDWKFWEGIGAGAGVVLIGFWLLSAGMCAKREMVADDCKMFGQIELDNKVYTCEPKP